MSIRRWRQGLVMLLALVLALGCPASAGEWELPAWLWFMRFDASPNAVRARFNHLVNHHAEQGQFDSWASAPNVSAAAASDGNGFVFYTKDAESPTEVGPVRFRITGQRGERGTVDMLRIDIAPSGAFSRAYLMGCDQLAQITAASVFGELDERTERDLLLALLYDLRPFSHHDQGPLTEKTRNLQTSIDGRLADMQWAAGPDNAVWFQIALGADADDAQIEQARLNNRCNRLLSQSSDECSTLNACLNQMIEQLGASPPDWPDLSANLSQAVESAAVIEELQKELSGYEKAKVYAAQMCAAMQELSASLAMAEAALDKADAQVLGVALDEALQKAKQAHRLIGVVRAQ